MTTASAIGDREFADFERSFWRPHDVKSWEEVSAFALSVASRDVPSAAEQLRRYVLTLVWGTRASYYTGHFKTADRLCDAQLDVLAQPLPTSRASGGPDAALCLRSASSYLLRNRGDVRGARRVLLTLDGDVSKARGAPLAAFYKEQGNIWRYVAAQASAESCYETAQLFLDTARDPDDDDAANRREHWSLSHFRGANDCELFEYSPLAFVDKADRLLEFATAHLRELDGQPPESINVPFVEKHRGFIAICAGRPEEGRDHFERAAERFKQLGYNKGVALSHYTEAVAHLVVAELARRAKEHPNATAAATRALSGFERGEAISRQAHYRRGEVMSVLNQGRAYRVLDEKGAAARLFGRARELTLDLGLPLHTRLCDALAAEEKDPPVLREIARTVAHILAESDSFDKARKDVAKETDRVRAGLRRLVTGRKPDAGARLSTAEFLAHAAEQRNEPRAPAEPPS